MRINRIELIEQLRTRWADLVQASDDRLVKDEEQEKVREHAYFAQTRDEWLALAERIQQRCNGNQAVLTSDIPDTLRRDGYLGFRMRKVERQPAPVAELKRLVGLLEASPDETVSLASLERAGFSLGKVLK